MLTWTLKALWHDRSAVLASAAGIALALLLALYLDGVFRGEADQIVAFNRHTEADVWVLQKGVDNLHMTHSRLTEQNIVNVASVEGVNALVPIIYTPASIGEPGHERVAYAVGVPAGARGVGPWAMSEGAAQPGPGRVVVPAALAAAQGLRLGDRFRIAGERLEIGGFSIGTFSMANPLVFLGEGDARRLFEIADGANVLLVRAPGVAPEDLARRIAAADDDVNPVTRQQIIERDYGLALEMGGQLIQLMSLIGTGVATLIVVFSAYAFAAAHRAEFAVAKALGAPQAQIIASALAQTGVLALLGAALALAALWPTEVLLAAWVPEVAVHFSAAYAMKIAAIALVIAEIAAMIPAAQMLRVDPALVFKG